MNDKSEYQYLPLQKQSRDIRVISLLSGRWQDDIQCSIQTISLDHQPDYRALSYVWGDPAITKPIFVDKLKVQVTTNLESALRHLREPDKPLTLWIDALCINQKDDLEKSHQVAMMGEIYRKCSACCIWLGCKPAASNTHPAAIQHQDVEDPFALIHHFADDKHIHELSCFEQKTDSTAHPFREDPSFGRMWDGFLKVAQSSWWSRVWTVQEAVLPPTATLRYGTSEVSWARILKASENLNRHAWKCCFNAWRALPDHVREVMNSFSDAMYSLEHDRDVLLAGKYFDLHEQLLAYSYRECKEPRDHIFGVLALLDPKEYQSIVPDYSLDTTSTFIKAVEAMFEAGKGDLRCLCGCGDGPTQTKLPSWVRDFAAPLNEYLSGAGLDRVSSYKLYDASSGGRAKPDLSVPQELRLRGIFLDAIRTVGPPRLSRVFAETLPVLSKWLSMANLQEDPSRKESFWRTMLGGLFAGYDQQTNNQVVRRYTTTDFQRFEQWVSVVEGAGEKLDSPDVSATFRLASSGRAFFLTEQGYMGLSYPTMLPGDELWVLYGGRVPFVLRPSQDKPHETGAHYYRLVGDCYLDGFMDGEAIGNPAYPERDVILR